jgi:3-hydroxyisobutyrate dehydrogenase
MKTIAFVGLGAMGRPMARNLIKAGFAVQGYDVNPAGLEDLKAAGGLPTGSAEEAFGGADAIVLMVVNAAQAEAVLFSNGALEAAPAETIVCLMATCPPNQVQATERVAMTGRVCRFFRYPASAPALPLVSPYAAPNDLFESVRPILEARAAALSASGISPGGAPPEDHKPASAAFISWSRRRHLPGQKIGVDTRTMPRSCSAHPPKLDVVRSGAVRRSEVTSAIDIFVKIRHRARSWPETNARCDDALAFSFHPTSGRRPRR